MLSCLPAPPSVRTAQAATATLPLISVLVSPLHAPLVMLMVSFHHIFGTPVHRRMQPIFCILLIAWRAVPLADKLQPA